MEAPKVGKGNLAKQLRITDIIIKHNGTGIWYLKTVLDNGQEHNTPAYGGQEETYKVRDDLQEIDVVFNDGDIYVSNLLFKHKDGSVITLVPKKNNGRVEKVMIPDDEHLFGAELEVGKGKYFMGLTFLLQKN